MNGKNRSSNIIHSIDLDSDTELDNKLQSLLSNINNKEKEIISLDSSKKNIKNDKNTSEIIFIEKLDKLSRQKSLVKNKNENKLSEQKKESLESKKHYDFALIHFNSKNYETALEKINLAISLFHLNPEYHYLLAKILSITNNHNEAQLSYKKAIELQPKYHEALFEYAKFYLNIQKPANHEKALELIDKAIESYNLNPEYHYLKGSILEEMNLNELAIESYSHSVKQDKKIVFEYYNAKSRVLLSLKRYSDIMNFCKEASKKFPTKGDFYFYLGRASQGLMNCRWGLTYFEKAIELTENPLLGECYYYKADCHFTLRHYSCAIDDYKIALELKPNDTMAYFYLGKTHHKLKEYELAFKNYNLALKSKILNNDLEEEIKTCIKELSRHFKYAKEFLLDLQEITEKNKLTKDKFLSSKKLYLAKYESSQAVYKIINFPFNPDTDFKNSFEPELLKITKINHSNLVNFYEYEFTPPNEVRLIMEFCKEGSLNELLHGKNKTHLSLKQKIKILIECAEGLTELHSRDIKHGNIHSNNILIFANVNYDYLIKLSDYGIRNLKDYSKNLTKNYCVFSPPEFRKNREYDLKSDIYAYGMLIWEVICQKIHFEEIKDSITLFNQISMNRIRPDLKFLPTDTPQVLVDLMTACWDEKVLERPNIEYIIEKLRNAYKKVLNIID